MEADKALYHVKQTTKNNYYFYRQVENMSDDLHKAELCNIIEALKRKDNFSDNTVMGEDDFLRMYQFVRDIAVTKGERIRLIMFTLTDGKGAKPQDSEEIMGMVETAILGTLPDESAISQYSSAQRIVLVMEDEKRSLAEIAKKIVTDFMENCGDDSIKLSYAVAEK
jgi:hypothetical protein